VRKINAEQKLLHTKKKKRGNPNKQKYRVTNLAKS
jgi:hypothetical protein